MTLQTQTKPVSVSQTKTPICHQCNTKFESWKELAQHVIKEKRTHKNRKSRAWALSFLSKVPDKVEIKHIPNDPDKISTEFGDENRENRVRRLSGRTVSVKTICPKCRQSSNIDIEVEYALNTLAWRIGNKLAILCGSCRGHRGLYQGQNY